MNVPAFKSKVVVQSLTCPGSPDFAVNESGHSAWTHSTGTRNNAAKSQFLIIGSPPIQQGRPADPPGGSSMVNVPFVSTSGTADKVGWPSNWHQRNWGQRRRWKLQVL